MRRLLQFLLAALLAVTAAAQFHPNEDRGFAPDKVYGFSDIDHINGFNGNLVLTVPIGTTYKVRGQLPYGLTLVYNSNVWDFLLAFGQLHDDVNAFYESVPNAHANAGMGWQLTFGRLVPPDDPTNASLLQWLYESSDGGSHVMASSDNGLSGFSADGSYLRMRTSGPFRYIDSPDGRTLTFSDHGTGSAHDWRTDAISDPLGNSVTISYTTPPGYADLWTISDSEGRTQKVYFIDATDTTHVQRLIQRIELTTPAGTATYGFDYALRTIDRSPKDRSGTNGQHGAPIAVRFLRNIWLPRAADGTVGSTGSFGFQAPGDTSSDPAPYYQTTGDYSGMISGLQLPTRGWLEWDYTGIIFPDGSADSRLRTHAYGVAKRRMYDGSRAWLGTWEYNRINGNVVVCSVNDPIYCNGRPSCLAGGPRQMVSVLTAPSYAGATRAATVTYYSIFSELKCPNNEGWVLAEYSAPLTRAVSQDGRYLSTESRDNIDPVNLPSTIDGQMQAGSLKRSQYVKYEYEGSMGQSWETNRRQSSSRTNFEDDQTPTPAGCGSTCYVSEDLFSWDGHGHYRQATTRSNFPQASNRTTFTNYASSNPSAWLFTTYSEQCVRNDATTSIEQVSSCDGFGGFVAKFNFDQTNGLLLSRRTFAGPSAGAHDVLSLFSYNGAAGYVFGNVVSEKYYGGDDPAQALSVTNLFAPLAPPQYDIEHSYAFTGAALTKHTAKYSGQSFNFTDADFWLAGSVKAVRNVAGLQSDLTYDARGRLVESKPATTAGITRGGWTKYIYSDASPGVHAAVVVQRLGDVGTVLAEASFEFDDLGRLVKEGKHMPDVAGNNSIWSYRITEHDVLGRKTRVSEFAASPSHYTTFTYDLFGRPLSVQAPDSSTTTYQYAGSREVDQTSPIAIVQGAPDTGVLREELHDAAGRLVVVKEKSGPTSAGAPTGSEITTNYGYDAVDHLISVSATGSGATQQRSFTYDGRGFMTAEQHPELGESGNGVTSYSYDARGHAISKLSGSTMGTFDLQFVYDSAERLSEVKEPDPNSGTPPTTRRPVKKYDFNGSGFALGKLLSATRFNYFGDTTYGTIKVIETYTYGGRDGSVSQRTTSVSRDDVPQAIQTFTTSFSANELGATDTITYPTCAGCSSSNLTLTNQYSRGFLQSVGSYGTLAYADNGMVNLVTHGGVNDFYTPDPSGLARPVSVQFTDWTNCAVTANVTAPSSVCASSAGNTASVNSTAGASYSWSISGGTIDSGQGTTVVHFTAGTSGQVIVTVTVTAACGSAVGSSHVAIDVPVATASVLGSSNIIAGGSATLQASLTGIAPWTITWSPDGFTQSNIQSSPVTRTVSPATTTTYTIASVHDALCSGTANGSATITVSAPPQTPTGVNAAVVGSQIRVTWNSTGADSYIIQRSFGGGAPQDYATGVQGTLWYDPDVNIGNRGVVAYVYKVVSVVGPNRSAASIADIATWVTFTDDPLQPQTTLIRGYHISELRRAIDQVRLSANLAPIWSTYNPATGPVFSWIVYEAQPASPPRDLFNALNQARTQLGMAPISYPGGITAPATNVRIQTSHIDTIRAGVK